MTNLVINIAQCNAQRIGVVSKINSIYTTCQIENIDIINFQEINIFNVKSFFERKGWVMH